MYNAVKARPITMWQMMLFKYTVSSKKEDIGSELLQLKCDSYCI